MTAAHMSLLAMVLVVLSGAAGASGLEKDCQGGGKDEKNVKVTLVVILASYDSNKVHPKLKDIAKEVRRRCKKLKGFKLELMTCRSMPANKKETFQLVENQVAYVVIRHGANKNNRVSLSVDPPKTGKITYRSVCGKFFPIVTPYHTKSGERLILAIRVQPCHGK